KAVDDSFGLARTDPLLNGPRLSPELRRLREKLIRHALTFYQNFRAQRPGDQGIADDLFRQQFQLGYIHIELRNKREARDHFTRAVEIARQYPSKKPNWVEYHDPLATALRNLAMLHDELGDGPAALKASEESVSLHRALVAAVPKDAFFKARLASAQTH